MNICQQILKNFNFIAQVGTVLAPPRLIDKRIVDPKQIFSNYLSINSLDALYEVTPTNYFFFATKEFYYEEV